MSVNTEILLPSRLPSDGLELALGRMAGISTWRRELPSGRWYPELSKPLRWRLVKAPHQWDLIIGDEACPITLEGYDGKMLFPRSSPFWCAAGLRLVRMFGGRFRYADAYDGWDVIVHPKRMLSCLNDDAVHERYTAMIMSVRPIDDGEMMDVIDKVAYKDMERPDVK